MFLGENLTIDDICFYNYRVPMDGCDYSCFCQTENETILDKCIVGYQNEYSIYPQNQMECQKRTENLDSVIWSSYALLVIIALLAFRIIWKSWEDIWKMSKKKELSEWKLEEEASCTYKFYNFIARGCCCFKNEERIL